MLENIPDEILLTIFSMLPPHFLLNYIATGCRNWNQLIESDFLWMNYFVDYFGEQARREWKALITPQVNWLALFKELSRRLNFRKFLMRGNVVEMIRNEDDSYKLVSNSLIRRNDYHLSNIPAEYREGGYNGYHLFHPKNSFENLTYDIDLYISVNITNSKMNQVLSGNESLEESQIAKKMGGIIVKQMTVEQYDLFGKPVWSINLPPLLRFKNEKKNYLTRSVNCTNIYHYPRKNYVLLGINTTGIKVLDCSNGNLVWENEDGPNKKIHLNDCVNNEFGIVDTFCSEFKTFHAWNIENGTHLWSINLRSLFKHIKEVPGISVPMALMEVVSGNFLLQPLDEDENQCSILIHATTGRVLMYFFQEIILQMATLSVEEQDNNDETVTMITNVILYTLNRICSLQFRYQHRKSDNALISMDCVEQWGTDLEFQSYSGIFETNYLWIPLDGRTIRKRRSERRDTTPIDELDKRYLFDLMFIHNDLSYLKPRLERIRLDNGSCVYKNTITLSPRRNVTLTRAGDEPMNLNRESVSIFGEVRSSGELFLITQTTSIDTVIVIDLETGSIKKTFE